MTREAEGKKRARARKKRPPMSGMARLELGLRDNFEAVVVAFIMALVIRCFFLEVFKIPTTSMEPTLHGDQNSGDRIMVSKFELLFDPVERFDVAVFKYPLDHSRNFIKRVVGVGPETLRLSGGDVFFMPEGSNRFQLATKSLRLQESIWLPVFNANERVRNYSSKWLVVEGKADFPSGHIELGGDGRPACLRYARPVYDDDGQRSSNRKVKDVKLQFQGRWLEAGEQCGASIHCHNLSFSFALSPGGKGVFQFRVRHAGAWETEEEIPFQAGAMPVGDTVEVAFMHFDGQLFLELDGDQVDLGGQDGSFSYRRFWKDWRTELGRDNYARIFLTITNGRLHVEELSLWRDLHYVARGVLGDRDPSRELPIPPGHYFMIGDNVNNSKDSRLWKRKLITLTDGRVVEHDADPRVWEHRDGMLHIRRDLHGVEHFIAYRDWDEARDREVYHKFVREDELVGKAFFTWWPLDRARLIR